MAGQTGLHVLIWKDIELGGKEPSANADGSFCVNQSVLFRFRSTLCICDEDDVFLCVVLCHIEENCYLCLRSEGF